MTGSILFWLRLLLYVVAFFYIVLTVITIVKNETSAQNINIRMTKVKEWVYKSRIALLFFLIGWMTASVIQYYHVYRIDDVLIIAKRNTDSGPEFDMYAPRKGEFTTRFCPDYVPPFRAGLRLEKLVYEDRGMCWSVVASKLGYIFSRVRR